MVRFDRLALGLFVLGLVGCGSTPEPSGSSPPPAASTAARVGATTFQRAQLRDAAVAKEIRDLALNEALRAGVASPRTMRAVAASDHQEAENVVSGAVIADHDPVVVVQMEGGPFVSGSHPRNSAPPQGDVLTITLDLATRRVTDIGYDAAPADLHRIDAEVVDLMAP
jgi:hypothetical protein